MTKLEKIKMMEDAIHHFQSILNAQKLIATGSFALYKMGLVDSVSDLDIRVINASQETLDILERLQTSETSKHLILDYEGLKGLYRIMYNGFKIDFFTGPMISGSSEDYISLSNGIFISSVRTIIKAKKECRRLKDILQLRAIANMFYEDSLLQYFLASETNKIHRLSDDAMTGDIMPVIDEFDFLNPPTPAVVPPAKKA